MTDQHVRPVDVGGREQCVKGVRLLVGGRWLRRLLAEPDPQTVVAADASPQCDLGLDGLPITVVLTQTRLEDDCRGAVTSAEEVEEVATSLILKPRVPGNRPCLRRGVTPTCRAEKSEHRERNCAACFVRGTV